LYEHENPAILHIATHGVFLTDKGRESIDTNLFLWSGIALAGANESAKADSGSEDGIMTAEKILGLNLTDTGMVVLSACETGMGQAKAGEGVYGLRRAFTQAGAQSIVMSMWSVPDNETKELMISFYRNPMTGTMTKKECLRQAALTQLNRTKAVSGTDNPFYWGGFVFLGQP
jgi:CHAT domain-containing protein